MSSFANAIAARTEQEAQLYLEVRGLHVTHAERRVEAERTWLDVTAQDANNAQGQAYHYTFELLEPEGEGLGSGAGSCLEATDLWDYAQARAPERVNDFETVSFEV
jgi:hypothetical protein